jgi:ABC-type hemin transport system ATPase subunit
MTREQDTVTLNEARNARCESKEARKANIEDLAKLGRAISTITAELSVPFRPVLPETLVVEVGRLPYVVRELELSTARRVVHQVLAMFKSHYQGMDRMALSGGWAPSVSDTQCNELERDCTSFSRDMADAKLLPQDAPEDSEGLEPSN